MVFALIWFAVIAAAFFVLAVLPQRRRVAAQRALFESLAVGDEVVTGGGLWGRVRALDDTNLSLEIADGVVVKIARAAVVGRAIPDDAATGAGHGTAADDAPEGR